MVKKIAMALLLALMLAPAASFAQMMIRVGPPPPVYERRGPPPGEGYVWQDGYRRYDGGQYVWTPGHYERPPHRGGNGRGSGLGEVSEGQEALSTAGREAGATNFRRL
jgi:hypothetical protein